MEAKLKRKLIELADKYETADFINKDPSQFMHRFANPVEQEVVAFLSANLAFGRRDQILAHIEIILQEAGTNPSQWILSGQYRQFFDQGKKSFYRMYTHDAMNLFFDGMKNILQSEGSIGNAFKKSYENAMEAKMGAEKGDSLKKKGTVCGDSCQKVYPCHLIPDYFDQNCTLIARGKNSAAKKLNMFLRWMVRDNSPVDLGLWNWYPKTDLLMPLDTHVMQEATKFGLLPKTASGKKMSANFKTALMLSQKMAEAFPEDPVRGDFALFGLGVDSENN